MLLPGEVTGTAWLPSCDVISPRQCSYPVSALSGVLIYDFLLVINTNLPPVLRRFRDIAVDRSEAAILGYPLIVFNSPGGEVPLG